MLLLAGVFSLGRFLRPAVRQKKTLLTVARAAIPNNGALVYREARVALIREAEGIYALDLVCTHLGCTVSVTSRELVCPCHGSVFDRRGNVQKGPADRPLPKYAVKDTGDHLLVLM